MSRPPRSPRASPRRRGHDRSPSRGEDDVSLPPAVASGCSWNVDRGRSRTRRASNSFSEESLRRRGYQTILSLNKVFHLERRWKLVRELGSGAYGVVVSAADNISGETVAIKLVTRVFEKVQFAKRALREITLLRHFSNHSNITGLIDLDAISSDFSEIYIFMEPMEADLHQIIRSGQSLTNEHVQYFTYQILRGMKYIHSAGVIHRDLKPGNLLVNADCELKICDFGLARGFESTPDENTTHLTEYVATRWYRAPEIMLAYRKYNTSIDIWSIGCIFAELLMGVPIFKGKDYVDQLNKIFAVLGTPDSTIIRKIGSPKAQAYVRALPVKKAVPFRKLMPLADYQALSLLSKMLTFDPSARITVTDGLEHPWLAAYHDPADEPDCPVKFEQWREIEKLETMEEFREAIWKEIEDYRREVRGLSVEQSASPEPEILQQTVSVSPELIKDGSMSPSSKFKHYTLQPDIAPPDIAVPPFIVPEVDSSPDFQNKEAEDILAAFPSISPGVHRRSMTTPTDPVMTYVARRSSLLLPSLQGSTYNSPLVGSYVPAFVENTINPDKLGQGSVVFPSQGYVVPARSRTGSTVGGEVTRKLLRTLSTVSIHEALPGIAGIAPIGITNADTEADAPPSEVTKDFGIKSDGEEEQEKDIKKGKFIV